MTLALLNISGRRSSTRSALGAVYALMAVGIGLVFGVLRLVNFAYGQLVMVGAYAVRVSRRRWGCRRRRASPSASRWSRAVVRWIDRLPAAPTQSSATLLVATFAVELPAPEPRDPLVPPARTVGSSMRSLDAANIGSRLLPLDRVVSVVIAAACLRALSGCCSTRTTFGLHMRAAAMDFPTARLLGVRADR